MDLRAHGIPYDEGLAFVSGYPDVFGREHLMRCVDLVEPHMPVGHGLPINNRAAPAPWNEMFEGVGASNWQVAQAAKQAAQMVAPRDADIGAVCGHARTLRHFSSRSNVRQKHGLRFHLAKMRACGVHTHGGLAVPHLLTLSPKEPLRPALYLKPLNP